MTDTTPVDTALCRLRNATRWAMDKNPMFSTTANEAVGGLKAVNNFCADPTLEGTTNKGGTVRVKLTSQTIFVTVYEAGAETGTERWVTVSVTLPPHLHKAKAAA